MPQAMDRLLATPMIKPRLPARMPAMNPPQRDGCALDAPRSLAEADTGRKSAQASERLRHLRRLALPSVVEERFVGLFGQPDLNHEEKIASALLAGQALAAQSEGPPRTGHGGEVYLHVAPQRRHPPLSAPDRILQGCREGPGPGVALAPAEGLRG